MLVTPNWTVNPTAASAITAAVTIPKPMACRNMRWLPSGRGPDARAPVRRGPGRVRGRLLDERCELGGRDRVHQGEVPARLVGRDLEAAGRVVPLVEVDDARGADIIDLLAGLQRRDAGRERMHRHRPLGSRGDRRDGRI